jgi:DNA-binding beta-propeller fold protein YncE
MSGNAGTGTVSVVDVASWTVLGTLPGGIGMMKFVPVDGGLRVWFPAPGEDQIKLLDLATGVVVHTIVMPADPHGMALSPDGHTLYLYAATFSLKPIKLRHFARDGCQPKSLPNKHSTKHVAG